VPGSTLAFGSTGAPKAAEVGITLASILEILMPDAVWFGISKSTLKGLSYLKAFSSTT
jgi:hypothetical protein